MERGERSHERERGKGEKREKRERAKSSFFTL